MKKLLLFGSLLLISQSCEKPVCGCVMPPLSSQTIGRWEWTKTVTPTRTLTAAPVSPKQVIEIGNNGSADYLAFYRNDTLQTRLAKSRTFYQEDTEKMTVLGQYNDQYLKFYLKNDRQELETSELMKAYSEKADTVRHFYKFLGPVQ